MKPLPIVAGFAVALVTTSSYAQESVTAATVVSQATAAANALLASLDDDQRAKLLFPFDDDQQRRNWSNLPVGMVPRGGLRMGDLTQAQQQAVTKMLAANLSPAGLQQVIDNMAGDEILKHEFEQRQQGTESARRRRNPDFGKAAYYVSILGTPSTSKPWMWQFGGHHLGINATIVGDRITLSPSLTGGQPVDFEIDGRQVRQLATEEDKSFELIGSLDEAQLKQAVLADDHVNMIYGPGKEGAQPKQEGIKGSELNETQRKLLLELIAARIGKLNEVHAKPVMDKITANLDETWFAWFGPTTPGSASSFRIQGPTILMEYSPQHLGGDDTNHTHAMYRDPTNDYGAEFLKGE